MKSSNLPDADPTTKAETPPAYMFRTEDPACNQRRRVLGDQIAALDEPWQSNKSKV